MLDPEKKEYYRKRAKALKLPNAYTVALTDYMRKPKLVKSQNRGTITYRITKPGFALKEVKVEYSETISVQPKVITRQKNDAWFVHHTPDNNTITSLTIIITDETVHEIKFADVMI